MAYGLGVKQLRFPPRSAAPQKLYSISDRAPEIAAEQTRLLYAQAPTGFVVTLLNAGIVTVVLWQEIAPPVLVTWFALIVVVTLARFLLVQWYHRAAPPAAQVRCWQTRFIIGASCAGLAWGGAGMFLFPRDSLVHQLFLAFVLGGMILGAVAMLSWVKGAFLAFLLPAALPITVRFFTQGSEVFTAMGVTCLIFSGALWIIARHQYTAVAESLALRFENLDLIDHLSVSEHQATAANAALQEEVIVRRRMEEALRLTRDALEARVQDRTAALMTSNAALTQAKEAAEAADRTKSEFLATVSHELRTPLNAILGYTQLFLADAFGELTSDQLYGLRRVDKNAQELLDLISAVLDVSRLAAGRLPVEIKEVRVAELLQELEAEAQDMWEQTQVKSLWKVQGDLPPLSTDPGKLKVVIKNLVGNALKFTEQGSITVEAQGRYGGIEIAVSDTGIGIAAHELPLIFEPFRQLESSEKRSVGGTGLGLHIVKRLLELLGGEITVESEVGRGSTFRVWLPSARNAPPL